MSKIYISGAIIGTTDYMKRFAKAQVELIALGYSVINPATVNAMLPEDTTYDEYMAMSMTMLEMCDAIYLLENWQDSKGANMELARAKELGLTVYYQMPEWKQRLLSAFLTR